MVCMIYFEVGSKIFDRKIYVRIVIDSVGLAAISAEQCVSTVLWPLYLEIHRNIDYLLSIHSLDRI